MPSSTLKKIILLIILALSITACDKGCVEADEFAIIPIALESNMKKMKVGVFGNYNHDSGGQYSEWYDTGLRTNGDKLTIYMTGGWIYTGGSTTASQEDVDLVALCNFCSKDISNTDSSQNCICHNSAGQVPREEIGEDGMPRAVLGSCATSLSGVDNYNNCSCFNRGTGYVTRYGVYHQIANSLTKTPNLTRTSLMGQKQSICRLNRGMGAYISLWGTNGAQIPTRAYHLFTEEEYCPVARSSNGECLRNGKNVLRHVYRSPNSMIFIKDDGLTNDLPTTSTSTPGFQYHGANEIVKVIMYDGYYDDNAGKYDLYFTGGFGGEATSFILEFITGLFEDVLLGKKDSEGVRNGGIIQSMYSTTVNYPPFQIALKLCLSLYITFFGASYLMGVIDITKKEVSMIILKLGLVILFTSAGSWAMYKMFVVNFFKDGMDSLMSMIMLSTDNAVGESSNLNFIAQGGRGIEGSAATRFSYPDMIMKKMLSLSVAKKLLAVIGDGNLLGIVYFFVTYLIIFYFIYVMLLVCSIYIVSMTKMILILALGPIFIVLALFSKTNDMFKSWVSFLGSRALEMALLFLVLSPFLLTIDRYFTDLLYFRVCGAQKGLPPVYLTILQTQGLDRDLFTWLIMLLKIAVVIFIVQNVIDRVSDIAGTLINIGGVPNQDTTTKKGYGESGFGLAIGAATSAVALSLTGAKIAASYVASKTTAPAMELATFLARKSGVADAFNAIGKRIPFRGPRTRMRDNVIESAIKEARKEGIAKGKTGKDLDQYTRDKALENLAKRIANEPSKMALLGVDSQNIAKVMDKVLVRDGMKEAIKEKARELKDQGLLGKEARQALRDYAKEWARDNLYDPKGESKVSDLLKDKSIRSFLRGEAEYSSSEAARIFTNESEKEKFLAHLQDNKIRNQLKWQEAKKNPFTKMVPYLLSRAKHEVMGDAKGNPNLIRKNFDRKAYLEENPRTGISKYNPLSYINFIDRRLNASKYKETALEHDNLLKGKLVEKLSNDQRKISNFSDDDTDIEKAKKEKALSKRDMMMTDLKQLVEKDIDRKLNDPNYVKDSPYLSELGNENSDTKEILERDLLNRLFIDDGESLIEKAYAYDYLTGKKGEESAEYIVGQSISNQLEEFERKISDLSPEEALTAKEEFKDSMLRNGLFASNLDVNQIDFINNKILESGDEVGDKVEKSKKIDNSVTKEFEKKLRDDLSRIDKKLDDKISELDRDDDLDNASISDNDSDDDSDDDPQNPRRSKRSRRLGGPRGSSRGGDSDGFSDGDSDDGGYEAPDLIRTINSDAVIERIEDVDNTIREMETISKYGQRVSKITEDRANQDLKEDSVAKLMSLQDEIQGFSNRLQTELQQEIDIRGGDLASVKEELSLKQQKIDTLYEIAKLQVMEGNNLLSLDRTLQEINKQQDDYSKSVSDLLAKLPEDKTDLKAEISAIENSKIEDRAIDLVLTREVQEAFVSNPNLVRTLEFDISRTDKLIDNADKVLALDDLVGVRVFDELSRNSDQIQANQIQVLDHLKDLLDKRDDSSGRLGSDVALPVADRRGEELAPISDQSKISSLIYALENLEAQQKYVASDYKEKTGLLDFGIDSMRDKMRDYGVGEFARPKSDEKSPVIATSFKIEFGAAISQAMIGGSLTDVFLKGGVPMIGGDYYSDTDNRDLSQVKQLESKKKMQELNLKMDKINIKMLEHELSKGEDHEQPIEKRQKLDKLKQKTSQNKRVLEEIDEQLKK